MRYWLRGEKSKDKADFKMPMTAHESPAPSANPRDHRQIDHQPKLRLTASDTVSTPM
jgi:hypothetical protein